jgi:hypothetical protein
MSNTGITGITKEEKIFRIGGTVRSKLLQCRKTLRPAAVRGKEPDRSHGRVLRNSGWKRNPGSRKETGKNPQNTPWKLHGPTLPVAHTESGTPVKPSDEGLYLDQVLDAKGSGKRCTTTARYAAATTATATTAAYRGKRLTDAAKPAAVSAS